MRLAFPPEAGSAMGLAAGAVVVACACTRTGAKSAKERITAAQRFVVIGDFRVE
jgi:hypothetical protein